jgi:hypothetical protein
MFLLGTNICRQCQYNWLTLEFSSSILTGSIRVQLLHNCVSEWTIKRSIHASGLRSADHLYSRSALEN